MELHGTARAYAEAILALPPMLEWFAAGKAESWWMAENDAAFKGGDSRYWNGRIRVGTRSPKHTARQRALYRKYFELMFHTGR